MKDFFQDIFEYHHYFNRKLANQLIEHENLISARSIPLFSHMMNAHQIWNARILKTNSLGVHDVHTLNRCKELDLCNFQDTVKILVEYDLHQPLTYKNSKGDELSNTIVEILFHVANHHTHHRAQIISDLRQHGITPFPTDYIFYKR